MALLNAMGMIASGRVKYVIIILIIAMVSGVFYYQDSIISDQAKELQDEKVVTAILSEEFIRVSSTNEKNSEAFAVYREEQKEAQRVVYASHKEEIVRLRKLNKELERIAHVKPEDDTPMSRVMLDTLEWMRQEDAMHTQDYNRTGKSKE